MKVGRGKNDGVALFHGRIKIVAGDGGGRQGHCQNGKDHHGIFHK